MSENEVRIDHKRDVLRLPNGVDMVTVTCHGYSQPTQIILSRSEPNQNWCAVRVNVPRQAVTCPGSRLTLRVETLRKAADLAASNGTVVHIPITTRGRVENFGVYAFHKLETHIFVGPFTSKNEEGHGGPLTQLFPPPLGTRSDSDATAEEDHDRQLKKELLASAVRRAETIVVDEGDKDAEVVYDGAGGERISSANLLSIASAIKENKKITIRVTDVARPMGGEEFDPHPSDSGGESTCSDSDTRPIDWEGFDPHPSDSGEESTCPRTPQCYLPTCRHCFTSSAGTTGSECEEGTAAKRWAVTRKLPVSRRPPRDSSEEDSQEQAMGRRTHRRPRESRR